MEKDRSDFITKEFYENGNLKSKGRIDEKGRRYGYWEFFDEKGRVRTVGKYKDGFKDSTWIYLDSNDTIIWNSYIDTLLNLKINFPSTFLVYPNYNNSKTLVLLDSVKTNGSHVNFNVTKYHFSNKSEFPKRVITISDLNSTKLEQKFINNRNVLMNYDTVNAASGKLFLNQAFLDAGSNIYLVNFFTVSNHTKLLDEVLMTIELDVK